MFAENDNITEYIVTKPKSLAQTSEITIIFIRNLSLNG